MQMIPYRKTVRTIFAFIVSAISILNVACGQSKNEKIENLINVYLKNGKFNGSVLLAEKGNVIYKNGFGMANMEWKIPNRPDTKFRLASVTKQFTSMLILQLVSENKLKLDVPITTYLPDYPHKTGDIITIHHLLTHTSGIPNYTSFPVFHEMMRDTYTPTDMVKLFADSTLEFTPGERFSYSNSGYILLGCIIEKVCGDTYEHELQKRIFGPLKMINSGYEHVDVVTNNRAAGYYRIGTSFQNSGYIDMSVPFSAGAIYSTVEDMYLWDQALYTEKLLPKKYMDLLFSKHIPDHDNSYGYGWQLGDMRIGNTQNKVYTISHSGFINGFNTQITRIPSDKSLIVLLNNTGGAPLDEMTTALIGILYDQPYDLPKNSLAYALSEQFEKNDFDAAVSYYKKIKDSNDYRIDENEMNSSGYEFLGKGKIKEAAFLFKLNVDAFPNSFNVYDSYGEALLALGNKKEAIENYTKSVQLNPGSKAGLRVLKEAGINTDTLIKKVPIEFLKLLEGEYVILNPPSGSDKYWKIKFNELQGELFGQDGGYRYKLVPLSDHEFVNPDDGASLIFDASDKTAITMMFARKFKFKKVI